MEHAQPNGPTLFLGAMSTACRPRRRLTVSQWADAHRVLSPKASSEPGPWRTARVPYVREIMDCLSVTSPVQIVTLMKASQVAGTEIGLNWIGYIMHHNPAPMLAVVPTLEVRKRWVRQRLDPMITDTTALAAIFDSRRKRDAMNTEDIKDFPGGMLIIGGANSPASLSSMPIKFVYNDEIDRFPWEAGKEGDPLGLVRKRQQTFPRRKELNVSSPTIKDASRIEELHNEGDQRRYHVPCPHCGELIVFNWSLDPAEPWNGCLQWHLDPVTKEPKDVAYMCGHCSALIEEHHKTDMLREQGHGGRARWIPRRPGVAARSYHINGLYAPLGLGLRWVELVREWIKCQDDKTKLKRFINTDLGEPWEDRTNDIKHNTLSDRAEPYDLRQIPPGCLIITCGVDVQANRFAIHVVGWGRNNTCWIIDYLEMPADPTREQDWQPLADYLNKPLMNAYNKEMRIVSTAIDSGYLQDDVAYFVRRRLAPRLMLVKGANTPGKAILAGAPKALDINYRNKLIKNGAKQWMVGTDTAKESLFARLVGDAKQEPSARQVRFSHELDDEYYKQLTSEVFDPEKNKWVKRRGRRNEALDTWVYAAAAARHPTVRVHTKRPHEWKALELILEPAGAVYVPVEERDEPAPAPAPTRRSGRRVISKGIKH